MADETEITAQLKILTGAYPDHKLNSCTLEVYLENLADIPAHLLAAAIKTHIQSSPWFPKISELRTAAARLPNTRRFETLAPSPAPHPDELAAEVWPLILAAQELEDAFYATGPLQGTLDPAAWESLAAQFDCANRPHRAEFTRIKFNHLQAIASNQPSI